LKQNNNKKKKTKKKKNKTSKQTTAKIHKKCVFFQSVFPEDEFLGDVPKKYTAFTVYIGVFKKIPLLKFYLKCNQKQT
jgi:hypothetical protein